MVLPVAWTDTGSNVHVFYTFTQSQVCVPVLLIIRTCVCAHRGFRSVSFSPSDLLLERVRTYTRFIAYTRSKICCLGRYSADAAPRTDARAHESGDDGNSVAALVSLVLR